MDWWNDIDRLANVVQAAKWFAAVGTVVLGVAGFMVFRGTTHLEELRARQAANAATKAAAEASDLRDQLAAARAAAANIEAAVQTERDARARLQAALGPRRLSDAQLAKVVSTLKATPPAFVDFVSMIDAEAGPLAEQIAGAMQRAGWRLRVSRIGMMIPTPYGLSINWAPAAEPQGRTLQRALDEAGLTVTVEQFPIPGRGTAVTPSEVRLLVGVKPPTKTP